MKKAGPLHFLGSLLVLAVFAAAAYLLYRQWHDNHLTLAAVGKDLLQIRSAWILAAVALTVINYGVLSSFDYLAFHFAKVRISLARVAFAAITTYAFSYNFGATLAGVPLRYRLYSSWHIPLTKIVQLLVILAFTFWFGVFALAGMLFIWSPLRIPPGQLQSVCTQMANQWNLPHAAIAWFAYLFADSRPFGVVLLALAGAYVGASFMHRGSLKIYRWTIPVPPPRLTLYQIGIASADMLVAASVFYVLCPHVHGGYRTVLEVYLVAYVLNVLSHVPGGWGVIEAAIMTLLGTLELVPNPAKNMPRIFAAIVAFRVVYFLLPLIVAAFMLAWHEYALRKNWITPLALDDESPNLESSESPPASSNGRPPTPAKNAATEKS